MRWAIAQCKARPKIQHVKKYNVGYLVNSGWGKQRMATGKGTKGNGSKWCNKIFTQLAIKQGLHWIIRSLLNYRDISLQQTHSGPKLIGPSIAIVIGPSKNYSCLLLLLQHIVGKIDGH